MRFKSLQELYAQGNYDKILALIREMGPQPVCNSDLLILKSRCLRLTDDVAGTNFQDIEISLRAAIECDETNATAWRELGWFLLNIQDKPKEAEEAFRRSLELLSAENTDLVIGLVRSQIELGAGNREEICKEVIEELVDVAEVETSLSE